MTAFHTAATPERILELETEIEKSMEEIANLRDDLDKCRNAALEEARRAVVGCLFDCPTHDQNELMFQAVTAIRSLKTKELK